MRPNNSDSTTGMANDVEFGLFSPPASQEEENDDDPTRTLISPPPEEELRRIGMISANKVRSSSTIIQGAISMNMWSPDVTFEGSEQAQTSWNSYQTYHVAVWVCKQ